MVPLFVMLVALVAFRALGAAGVGVVETWPGALRCALVIPSTARAAAYGLIALLAAMFPANIYAARQGVRIAGRRATPLALRAPLQLFWMAALWWSVRP